MVILIIISLLQYAIVVVEEKSTGIKILVDFGHQTTNFYIINTLYCMVVIMYHIVGKLDGQKVW